MRVGRHNKRANEAAGVTVKRTRHTQYCELINLLPAAHTALTANPHSADAIV